MSKPDKDTDRQAIIEAIAAECAAFHDRDFDRWASFWLHHPDTRRLGTLAGGHVDYKEGWNTEASMMRRIMDDHPKPEGAARTEVRRSNMMVRIHGDMAWASFDQYTPRTEDIFVNVGLSHQIRVFERHDGQWKVAFAGHGDTRVEYFDFPTIRVDRNAAIQWMNDAARERLPDHPILIQSASCLRARHRRQDKQLREALTAIADVTALDVRQWVKSGVQAPLAVALVFEDDLSDAFHLVWVAWQDGMILVTFDDEVSAGQSLDAAQSIYSLSETQMRLAALIVEGRDLGQAAEAMGISVNTARTHLQRMFDKTKVRSQTALVRVLLSAHAPTD